MNEIQVIYASKVSGVIDDAQIALIHSTALRNNTERNVTGMLLYSKGTFLQVIEGPEEAIDKLMRKIKSDHRHHDLAVLARSSIKHREFKNWSMGYRKLEAADVLVLPNFAPFFEAGFDANKFCEHPGVALEILRSLASQLSTSEYLYVPRELSARAGVQE